MEDHAAVLEKVTKEYRLGNNVVKALNGMDLVIPSGVMAAIIGSSGSGKTTLLNLLGALDRPTSEKVSIVGTDMGGLSEAELTAYRRKTVGFVFQDYGLIPNLTALENVMLPMEFACLPRAEAKKRARSLLDAVSLGHRVAHRPNRLSGGEQQRVAIARSMANDPAIILADEPTGNLDTKTGNEIIGLMRDLVKERKKTAIIVTHDEVIANSADLRLHKQDGQIREES
ncbi:MAG: ABC transporter ATP-binding protein [Deltaproteobacteria bacterium]|nr:ABC transporter ATP-binding protein [Deltaproteobacteria bacterium]